MIKSIKHFFLTLWNKFLYLVGIKEPISMPFYYAVFEPSGHPNNEDLFGIVAKTKAFEFKSNEEAVLWAETKVKSMIGKWTQNGLLYLEKVDEDGNIVRLKGFKITF